MLLLLAKRVSYVLGPVGMGLFALAALACGSATSAEAPAAPAPAGVSADVPLSGPMRTGSGAPTATVPVAGPVSADELAAATHDGVRPEAVAIPGSSYVRGRSTVTVNAPIQRVRDVVLAFAQYSKFMPHYVASKVLGRAPSGGREVYLEVEAMSGVIKFWAELELPPMPVTNPDGSELYETKFIKGNVSAFDAAWRLRKASAATTELTLEVYLEPKLSLPGSALNHENLKGSAEGVVAMKLRAEKAKK